MKEKDYPPCCYNGKEKFEAFCRDFKIYAPSKLPHAEQYNFFRDEYYFGSDHPEIFDHASFWMTEERDRIYYAVLQPYMDRDKAIKTLQRYIDLRKAAAKYNYKITIYDDGKYSWHGGGCIFILFQLNDPEDPLCRNAKVPLLDIKIKGPKKPIKRPDKAVDVILKSRHIKYRVI